MHSFYTGVENIIIAIIKDFDQSMPTGKNWHKSALLAITESTNKRKAIISDETLTSLLDYLGFRHFYRHSYSFHLDWDQLGNLILNIKDVWKVFKNELTIFQNWLKNN